MFVGIMSSQEEEEKSPERNNMSPTYMISENKPYSPSSSTPPTMKSPLTIMQRPTAAVTHICSNCLSRITRKLSSSSLTGKTKNPPSPPAKGYTHLSTRRLLSLTGIDTTQFLQGAITRDMFPSKGNFKLNTGLYAAFLAPKGRMLHDVFIYRDHREGVEDGYLIEVDANEVESLEKHVKRYRLRKKMDVRVIPREEMGVWSIWGEEGRSNGKQGDIGMDDSRAPGMGRRLVLEGNRRPEVDMEESTEDAYLIRRFLNGVPEGQGELLRDQALPQESNLDYMQGVDYDKGCYVGQELTIRTHHQGVVRKRILPVVIYGADESEPTELEYEPTKDFKAQDIPKETSIDPFERRGRSAGKFLAGIGNIGLGLCRLEMMTDVRVQGEAGGYKKGDEFKLSWEVEGSFPGSVKVKAFIPPWHPTQGSSSQ